MAAMFHQPSQINSRSYFTFFFVIPLLRKKKVTLDLEWKLLSHPIPKQG
jgi:hypothetical protein